ncbi:PAS domain-containing protein [Aerosakkonemataceae cyanobacterium BLCC-F50]|uniref:histidine kinase n=1 Tax=Floridaenema flaviceps BLCC-F50 TaxID=3153642 RepID=A0ABV4XRQ6_9CYAN
MSSVTTSSKGRSPELKHLQEQIAQLEQQLAQAQQREKRSRQLLQSIIDASSDWIFVKDRNFRCLLANQSFATAIGTTSESILGKNELELGYPEEVVFGNSEAGIRGFRHDDLEVLAGKTICNPLEISSTVEGIRIVDVRKIPLYDDNGEVYAVLGFAQDITDRKRAETEFYQTKNFLESVLSNLPVAVVAKEAKELRFAFFNQAASQLFGLSADQVLGKNDYDLFTKEQAEFFINIDRQVLASGKTIDISEEDALIQGENHILRTKKTAILDELGQAKYLLAITEDITERKRAEQALKESEAQLRKQTEDLEQTLQELRRTQTQLVQSEKMSSLGQLVAGVAHEINNPVNFIFGNLSHAKEYTQDLLGLVELYQEYYPNPHPDIQAELEAIELDFLTEDLPKLLNSMKVGADRIQKIVASLRTFSRMDEAEMKEVNIHEGIDSTLMILQNRLKAKPDRPEIKVIKEYGDLPLVECYAGQLNQVFMNIVANAIDALEDAYNAKILVNPAISIHTKIIENNQVMIILSDNGPGITQKVKSHLFDPFFTTKPIGKGTGMGLSISYQIITEKHHGTLDCFSEPGKGTEFVIKIPLKQPVGLL